ncbi:MAG: helix-turn-helix domain-containing protein [Lachnospiraceae bacterium]|nr:helix-turn-helix domain-containing protein [Lachnospiraceae bacterium]
MTDEFDKANGSEDYLCKKKIGSSLKKYREEILQITRERFGDLIGCKYYTLENIERGVSYPDINFMTEFSNRTGSPIYPFIMGGYEVEVPCADRELIGDYPEEVQMTILLRAECEKYNILHMYDKKMIAGIFDSETRMKYETIGYLVRFEREKRGMSKKELANLLGFEEKSIHNFEYGNSHISFRALNKICNIMRVPMDYFVAGYLENKGVVIDYLLMDLFGNTNPKERNFLEQFIRLLRYRVEMDCYTEDR